MRAAGANGEPPRRVGKQVPNLPELRDHGEAARPPDHGMPRCAGADTRRRLHPRRDHLGVPAGRPRRLLATGQRLPYAAADPARVAERGRGRAGQERGRGAARHPADPARPGLPRGLLGSCSSTTTAPTGPASRRPGRASADETGSRDGYAVVRRSPDPGRLGGQGVGHGSRGCTPRATPRYVLFTDADIGYAPGDGRRAGPGGRGRRPRAGVADGAAAGGHVLGAAAGPGVRLLLRPALPVPAGQQAGRAHGGRRGRMHAGAPRARWRRRAAWSRIRGARIDDVALGRLLKSPPDPVRCWLGLTTSVVSRRPYPRLAGLWDMIARSAYTQLRYSPAALAGTLAGLLWLYALPPAAALGGLAWLACGRGAGGRGGLAGRGGPGRLGDHGGQLRPDPAAVPAVAVAGAVPAADRRCCTRR